MLRTICTYVFKKAITWLCALVPVLLSSPRMLLLSYINEFKFLKCCGNTFPGKHRFRAICTTKNKNIKYTCINMCVVYIHIFFEGTLITTLRALLELLFLTCRHAVTIYLVWWCIVCNTTH